MKTKYSSLLVVVLALIGSGVGRANFIYTLIDDTDHYTFTYDSPALITSDTVVPLTTSSDPQFVSFDFEPVYPVAFLNRNGLNFSYQDQLVVDSTTSLVPTYVFFPNTFDTAGSYDANTYGQPAELTIVQEITSVPEPTPYGLGLVLVGVLALRNFVKRFPVLPLKG